MSQKSVKETWNFNISSTENYCVKVFKTLQLFILSDKTKNSLMKRGCGISQIQ